jgi:hypothetical protein
MNKYRQTNKITNAHFAGTSALLINMPVIDRKQQRF